MKYVTMAPDGRPFGVHDTPEAAKMCVQYSYRAHPGTLTFDGPNEGYAFYIDGEVEGYIWPTDYFGTGVSHL